jgi:hypothetical protein
VVLRLPVSSTMVNRDHQLGVTSHGDMIISTYASDVILKSVIA